MGAERYEVVIASVKTGRQTKRTWNSLELVKGVPWLKRMNAQGADIYVGPLDGPELMLIDSLDAEAIKDMHRQGVGPAVAIETSPGRFQAWVRLPDQPLPEGQGKHARPGLAHVFPKVGQHGRLAGFTNQKLEPDHAGRRPYVLAREVTGNAALSARPNLATVEWHIRNLEAKAQQQIELKKTRRAPSYERGRSR